MVKLELSFFVFAAKAIDQHHIAISFANLKKNELECQHLTGKITTDVLRCWYNERP